jgi:hypothetical protein
LWDQNQPFFLLLLMASSLFQFLFSSVSPSPNTSLTELLLSMIQTLPAILSPLIQRPFLAITVNRLHFK